MSEYWVSTAKRYCDACKCYIGDNKPSIQNHEGGKRHKENVARRLEGIAKRGAKMHAEKTAYEKQMARIEAAALAALGKDGHISGDRDRQLVEEAAARVASQGTKSYYEQQKIESSRVYTKKDPTKELPTWQPIKTPDETVGIAGSWVTIAVRDLTEEPKKEDCDDVKPENLTEPVVKKKRFGEKVVTLGEGISQDESSGLDTKVEVSFKRKVKKGNFRPRPSTDD